MRCVSVSPLPLTCAKFKYHYGLFGYNHGYPHGRVVVVNFLSGPLDPLGPIAVVKKNGGVGRGGGGYGGWEGWGEGLPLGIFVVVKILGGVGYPFGGPVVKI